MLRIKKNVDLKELKKFGFIKRDDYYIKLMWGSETTGITICETSRHIVFNDYYEELDLEKWTDTIFDLVQAGMVEKKVKRSK